MAVQTDPYIRRDPPNLGIRAEVWVCLNGVASVGTDKFFWYAKHNFIIQRVSIYSSDAPTGASLIVDTNLNGTTIFTDQSKRPEVAIGENSDDSDTPDVASISKGNRISFDVDQVGSVAVGGNPLMITLVLVKTG